MEPLKHESKDFDILINYSREAKDKEMFKFLAKTKNKVFEIPSDVLLEIIAKNFKQKEVASAFMDADQKIIPAVEAILPVHFVAPKDYKQGEIVQFNAPMVLPYFFATVMDAYKLVLLDKSKPVIEIPQETYDKANKDFEETNKSFVETFWKKELEGNEKLRNKAAETAKAD